MRIIALCMLLSVPAIGQEFGPTADPAFQESLRPEEPVLIPQTERLEALRLLSSQLATEEEYQHGNYVVMFSASYCGPCQTMKHKVLPIVEKSVGKVRVVDVQLEPQWNVPTLPTFWVCDRASQTRIEPPIVGVCSAEILIKAVKTRTKSKTTERDDKTVTRTVIKQMPMTHSDMVRLHDSLHGGGVHWSWTGDLKTHLRTVHGVDVN